MFGYIVDFVSGFFVADFMSGVIHWVEDTYFNDYFTTIPIVKDITRDNEFHHYFPRGMLAYRYVDHLTVLVPFVSSAYLIWYYFFPTSFYTYPVFYASCYFFSISANITHRLSHMKECELSYPINFLQQIGLLSSHDHHAFHHKLSNVRYCGISSYTNYLLDYIQFWRILEFIVFNITGIPPIPKSVYSDYESIYTDLHRDSYKENPPTPTLKDIDMLFGILDKYKKS
jgi:ubiquitin-conjugating enzyme E2 variant